MLLFRSGEHARRWGAEREPAGETVSLAQAWEMALAWFGDRMERDWQRTPVRARRMLRGLGLTGRFWDLPGA